MVRVWSDTMSVEAVSASEFVNIAYDDSGEALIVLSFDPGVTTGWALHRLDRSVLLTDGFTEAIWSDRSGWTSGQLVGSENSIAYQMLDLTRFAYSLGDYTPQESGLESGGLPDDFMIVMEDFIPRMIEGKRSFLSPVRVFAKFELLLEDRLPASLRVPYVKQSASDAKNVVTDQRLVRWNVYRPGLEHARDAQRHGILAARKYAGSAAFRQWVRTGEQSS
jgi:hypothetical protein